MILPLETEFICSEESVTMRFEVPADYVYLNGHFPGNPIVPGVTQVGWAMAASRKLLGVNPRKVRRFRFVKPLLPGQRVELMVRQKEKGILCEIHADGVLASKGSLIP